MKLVFLRGAVPTDRDPKEIAFDSLAEDNDMWTHLACALGDEQCQIVYWGGNRIINYSYKNQIIWVKKIERHVPCFEPDVIFERGGFDEGRKFSKRYPNAFRIYYGGGKRYMPKNDHLKYDMVLVDSERQLAKAKKHGWNAQLWTKPAAPQFKYMSEIDEEYDVCYVATIPEDERKRCKWVYKTCPKDLKVLQLGYKPKHLKVPKNFTIKRVDRSEMPLWMNRCRVGIAPYTKDDSAPRVIPEMMACGIPVICSDEVHQHYPIKTCSLDKLWTYTTDSGIYKDGVIEQYTNPKLSIQQAAEYIRGLIRAK